jgi:hypothetical protein
MHTTVAHYASIPYPIPGMGRGVSFLGDKQTKRGGIRRVGKSGEWSPAWKTCQVCNERKLFARANNTVCSRKCASVKMWADRKEEIKK